MSKNKEKFQKIEFSEKLIVKQNANWTLIRISKKSVLYGFLFWWPTRFIRKSDRILYRNILFKESDRVNVRKYHRFLEADESELIDLKVLPASKISELLREE